MTTVDAGVPEPRPTSSAHGLGLLYLVAVLLLVLGWNRSADVIVDFGRELYVPWELVQGSDLYNDLEYFNGPFSPLVNAALYLICGDQMVTLVIANFVSLLLMLGILYIEFGRFQRTTVTILQGLCLLVFGGFNHTSAVGNFNFITPYSHETTHGLLLSMVMFAALRRERLDRATWQILVGFCFGCVVLMKAEFALACCGMLGATLFLERCVNTHRDWESWALFKTVSCWLAGTMLAVGLFWIILYRLTGGFDPAQMLGSLRWIAGSRVTELAFYQKISGTDEPLTNLFWSLSSVASLGLILLGLKLFARSHTRTSPVPSLICFGLALFVGWPVVPLVLDGRSFTILGFVIVIVGGWWMIRHRPSMIEDCRRRRLMVWTVFGLGMLAKMALNPMLDFYGFILATPMAIALVGWLLVDVPLMVKTSRQQSMVQSFLAAMIILDLLVFAGQSLRNLRNKPEQVSGLIWSDAIRASDLSETLEYLDENLRQDETFLVLPEGVTLNYLMRRSTGVRYYNFMPPELLMFGEANIIDSFEDSPPDVVLLLDRPVEGYGMPPFGTGNYGVALYQWVLHHYDRIHQVGGGFRADDGFGVDIYRRKPVESP